MEVNQMGDAMDAVCQVLRVTVDSIKHPLLIHNLTSPTG